MMDTLKVTDTHLTGVTVVVPVGRIDLETSEAFQARLLATIETIGSDGNALLIDMTGVDYINSVGLRALMIGAKQCKANDTRIAVAKLSTVVQEIFDISRFSYVVEIFDTVPDALAALSDAAAAEFNAD